MNELFEKTLVENKIYCELVDANSDEQLEQLKVCNALMDEIKAKGLLIEYGEYCKSL